MAKDWCRPPGREVLGVNPRIHGDSIVDGQECVGDDLWAT